MKPQKIKEDHFGVKMQQQIDDMWQQNREVQRWKRKPVFSSWIAKAVEAGITHMQIGQDTDIKFIKLSLNSEPLSGYSFTCFY